MINQSEMSALIFVVVLFLGMLACLEVGRRLGDRVLSRGGSREGLGPVEGAIFALFGLLVAFTFSGAATRFEDRRHVIVEEANDIGTAYLRIDLLPADAQPEIRDLFRRYTDTRAKIYHNVDSLETVRQRLAESQELQNEIWQKSVVAAARTGNTAASMLLLPALNAMIDITTTRISATENHPPNVIFAMLGVIALATSLMAGFEMAGSQRRSWLHIASYALIFALSVYVILDLEYPRMGLIRVDSFDHYLVDVRNTMK
jgi:hypothetical protein